jgi:hypothetical protein
MKLITTNVAIFVVTVFTTQAGQTNSVPFTNWGEPVSGVQMADELQNSVVAPNTVQVLCLKLRNSSTNVITLDGDTNSTPFFLTNNIGKQYELRNSPENLISEGWDFAVKAGETRNFCVRVIVGKEVPPGDYTLVGDPRDITIGGGKVYRLFPGVQTVHVK